MATSSFGQIVAMDLVFLRMMLPSMAKMTKHPTWDVILGMPIQCQKESALVLGCDAYAKQVLCLML